MFAKVATVMLIARFLVLLFGISDVARPLWRLPIIPWAVLCIATVALVPVLGLAPLKAIDVGLLSLAVIVSFFCLKFYPSFSRSISIPAGDLIVPIHSLFKKIRRSKWFNTSEITELFLGCLVGIRRISINPILPDLEKRIGQPGTSTVLWFGVFILILLASIDQTN